MTDNFKYIINEIKELGDVSAYIKLIEWCRNVGLTHHYPEFADVFTKLLGDIEMLENENTELREQLEKGVNFLENAFSDAHFDMDEELSDTHASMSLTLMETDFERPMTGFLATLTPEQLDRIFSYKGDIRIGNPDDIQ